MKQGIPQQELLLKISRGCVLGKVRWTDVQAGSGVHSDLLCSVRAERAILLTAQTFETF